MKFLIQTINGQVKHDFSFTLIESLDYYNWYYNNTDIMYILSDGIDANINDWERNDVIPIGSVEFVNDYLKKYYNKEMKPINIPYALIGERYTKRDVIYLNSEEDLSYLGKRFVKSHDKIKGLTDILDLTKNKLPIGNYMISEVIDIHSEWRAFVYKDKLVGLNNYSGDFTIFPDVELIEEMIKKNHSTPVAYTLDVGINDKGTFIIEVHAFMSCGLYGFADLKNIPFMYRDVFKKLI
jgi:hypothetical protein